MPRLTLLDDPTWDERPLPGGKVRELLAALALAGRRGAAETDLLGRLWEPPPTGGVKALQVVVARTRTVTGPDAVVRTATGYRLGDAVTVDAWTLHENALRASDLLHQAPAEVVALLERSPVVGAIGDDPLLPALRRAALADHDRLRRAAGSASSRLGRHPQALALWEGLIDLDEPTLADQVRSVAAVHGIAAGLDRFEEIRIDLADRLGIGPSAALQAVHAELLAADTPVHTGIESPRQSLLGRDSDLAEVRAGLSSSRLVTLLGSGGLGKTTLAQEVARTATVPVIHVVPLVAVVDDVEVSAAVADALGVRESTSERRARGTTGPAVVGRIAAALTGPPVLLVLDNCEQVVDGVADLVARLLMAVPRLTVLATSRTPLQLAAERIVALPALKADAAAELFRSRAEAVRPGVELPSELVEEIVTRLDGVPLAVELAAAQVRLRSVAEIASGLDARFELLRGGPRDLPDRHRTLLAVIDWSWQLLDSAARAALEQLSVFRNPFGWAAARSVLGSAADEAVATLAEHSLLTVEENGGAVRFRLLETVREFGALRLTAAGSTAVAEKAVRDWAVDLISSVGPALGTGAEVAAVQRLTPELPELAEVLRRALAADDLDTVLALGHPLGLLWLLRGERARMSTVAVVGRFLVDQTGEISDGRTDPARSTLAMAILAESFLAGESATDLREVLQQWGTGDDPRIAAQVRVALVPLDENLTPDLESLRALTGHDDPLTASLAWQWATFVLENQGDFEEAIEAARSSLALLPPDPPASSVAMLLSVQSQLLAHLGRTAEARVLADRALSLFQELLSDEDVAELRALTAMIDLGEGRLADVHRAVRSWPQITAGSGPTSSVLSRWVLAELALQEGDITGGLAAFDAVLGDADAWFPVDAQGLSTVPWSTGALAVALVAYARWAGDGRNRTSVDRGRRHADRAVATARLLLRHPRIDFPLLGSLVYAIAAWNLLVLEDFTDPVLHLLALAGRLGHGMTLPTWPQSEAVDLVRARCPERWPEVVAELADRSRPELRELLARNLDDLQPDPVRARV